MTTNIKKDIIGTNLVRNGYLRAGEALHHHPPPHYTADKWLRVGLGLSHLPSSIMPNLESVHIVVHILHMTEAEVIKEDIATIKNKAPKQVKGMHLKMSLIWLSEYRGWKVSLSKLPLTWGFPTMFHWMFNLDQAGSPHHNVEFPKRSVDNGRRRDNDEVSLLDTFHLFYNAVDCRGDPLMISFTLDRGSS